MRSSSFGLASCVYSRFRSRQARVAEALDSGMVGVKTGLITNGATPFGSARQYGWIREGALLA